jgi:flagellum-specific peptidoglycan hydrolase FlgJ
VNKVEKRKDTFLSILKDFLINCCVQERVLPSIFAAIAIKSSDWGNDINSTLSLNLFNLTADMSTWYGKCLNTSTHEIYENKSQSSDVGSVLIRAYDTYEEAISDYVTFVMNYKRGNGPYKYHVIKNCTDYKTAINKLVRAGFMQDQFYTVDDISKIQELIAIIEEYKLYEWDEKLKEAIKEDEECLRKIRS